MKRHFIIDTHSDTLMYMIDQGWDINDDRLQVSLKKMLKGGHDLQVFACFVNPAVGKNRFITRALQMIDLLKTEVQKNRNKISICDSMRQIQKARKDRKKIALLGIEGGHAIQNDLAILRTYRNLGVIYMTLTWSNTNDWADSSNDVERWGGLTDFGREVVQEMNEIGMIVDISHVSDKAFWHALETSTKPMIASHSSVRGFSNHPRNMTDEMIKALAKKGGVVFINFYPVFIDQKFYDAYVKLAKRLKKRLQTMYKRYRTNPLMGGYEEDKIMQANSNSLPSVTMTDVIRHIEHVVKIAGVEAVGFGSDFDGTGFMPDDMQDCTSLPRLCEELHKRKFKSTDIDKIACGNFLRIFSDAVG
jgi:membrane dipeptidase